MHDYKNLIKELFIREYSPFGDGEGLYYTTSYILGMFQGVIPSTPISEHDVFDVLVELGFRQELVIRYKDVCIFEGDQAQGLEPEYDKVEVGRSFKWLVYEQSKP